VNETPETKRHFASAAWFTSKMACTASPVTEFRELRFFNNHNTRAYRVPSYGRKRRETI
jgi:hypothetical protein